MYSHVMVGVNDIEESKKFYDAILGTLGAAPGKIDENGRIFYKTDSGVFGIGKPINGEPACAANGGTIGFSADSSDVADLWHAAGIANGGTTCEDPPGFRGAHKMYLAYLRDPTGNKLCILHRTAA